jgi:leukotriene-A4 hydrolase
MSAVPSEQPPPLGDTGGTAAPGLPHVGDASGSGDTKVFYYTQKVPIPSYLTALAVGQLESRELSPKSCVWSEPSMVDAGAYEFAETAKFLDAGGWR